MQKMVSALEHSRRALVSAERSWPAEDVSWIDLEARRTPWRLADDALALLVVLVRELAPRHVLEFGSGVSTFVLASTCGGLAPPATVTSLDHDPHYARVTAAGLRRDGLADRVALRTAPLVCRRYRGRFVPVYWDEAAGLADDPPPDLVLVDGPPSPLGGREGAVYEALEQSQAGTILLLDDASRAHESTLLDRIGTDFGPALEVRRLDGFSKGLGAILVRDPAPLRSLADTASSPVSARQGEES